MPADAATPGHGDTAPGLKLHEICGRIGTNYDEARYALARGLLTSGIAAKRGHGRHPLFDPWQAFTLSIPLKLKAGEVTTEAAQQFVDFAPTIQKQAVNLGSGCPLRHNSCRQRRCWHYAGVSSQIL